MKATSIDIEVNKVGISSSYLNNENVFITLDLAHGPSVMLTTPLSQPWRVLLLISIAAASLLSFAWLASWFLPSSHSFDIPGVYSHSYPLAKLAFEKVLQDASPIFGLQDDNKNADNSATSTWMKAYSDDTLLVHLNIPGAHDAATWNYTRETQHSLHFASSLADISPADPSAYRCQDKSLAAMLEAGIRAFDLRYAWDITRTTVVFWHGDALQSETATVADVLYAFYDWLDRHPSEAVFLSFQHEGPGDDVGTQLALYEILTSPAAKRYISQTRGVLGTLGAARGKITLFRRFDLSLLAPSHEESLPGLHFSPTKWTVNGANIALEYNESTSSIAYIQDYFHPQTPKDASLELNVRWKLNATISHFERAGSDSPSLRNSLFWSFASSTKTDNEPPSTPRMLALGDEEVEGVNMGLVHALRGMKGRRLGIVMFDFVEEPGEVLGLFMRLLTPSEARNYGK